MILLALAALCVAYQIVVSGMPWVSAVEQVLPWMWLGQWVFIVVIGVAMVVYIVICLLMAFFGDSEDRVSGIIGVFLAAPLLIVFGAISQGLYLAGIYCVDHGIESGEITNQSAAIIGCALYVIAILFGRFGKAKN